MALLVLLDAIYLLAIRPSQLRWGATADEVARSMPGDDLVSSPTFCATRGISIQGRPEDIWPWLAQMGYGRAGFYGYDLIENVGSRTGIRSAVSILPELQHPKTGDVLPISAAASLVFDSIQPGSHLIWRADATPPDASFIWALYPVDESHTRLISRIRLRYHWADQRLLLDLFTEFADHVAVPKILLGIKGRVEGRPRQPLAREAMEIMVWVLGLPENELTAGSVVAKVEPIQNPGMGRPLVDSTPRFARIYTANHEIDLCVLGDLLYLCPHALPVGAVNRHGGIGSSSGVCSSGPKSDPVRSRFLNPYPGDWSQS